MNKKLATVLLMGMSVSLSGMEEHAGTCGHEDSLRSSAGSEVSLSLLADDELAESKSSSYSSDTNKKFERCWCAVCGCLGVTAAGLCIAGVLCGIGFGLYEMVEHPGHPTPLCAATHYDDSGVKWDRHDAHCVISNNNTLIPLWAKVNCQLEILHRLYPNSAQPCVPVCIGSRINDQYITGWDDFEDITVPNSTLDDKYEWALCKKGRVFSIIKAFTRILFNATGGDKESELVLVDHDDYGSLIDEKLYKKHVLKADTGKYCKDWEKRIEHEFHCREYDLKHY